MADQLLERTPSGPVLMPIVLIAGKQEGLRRALRVNLETRRYSGRVLTGGHRTLAGRPVRAPGNPRGSRGDSPVFRPDSPADADRVGDPHGTAAAARPARRHGAAAGWRLGAGLRQARRVPAVLRGSAATEAGGQLGPVPSPAHGTRHGLPLRPLTERHGQHRSPERPSASVFPHRPPPTSAPETFPRWLRPLMMRGRPVRGHVPPTGRFRGQVKPAGFARPRQPRSLLGPEPVTPRRTRSRISRRRGRIRARERRRRRPRRRRGRSRSRARPPGRARRTDPRPRPG